MGDLGATEDHAGLMNRKVNLVDRISNGEYIYEVVNLLKLDLLVNRCVLKCGGGILELLTAMEAVPSVPRSWHSKVRTVLMCVQ